MSTYPNPWRWEPNGAGGESLVAADGTEIIGGAHNCRVADPVIRIALQHADETAKALHDLTSPNFTSCNRNPDCGTCSCCRAFGLFETMRDEINALRGRGAAAPS